MGYQEDVQRQSQQPAAWCSLPAAQTWKKEEYGKLGLGSSACALGMHDLILNRILRC